MKNNKQMRISIFFLVIILTFLFSVFNTSGANSLSSNSFLKKYEPSEYGSFKEMKIGEKTVYYRQRYVGEAIVEGDFLAYSFDKSGNLVRKREQKRKDVPGELPKILDKKEILANVEGNVRNAWLVYIADNSPVYPIVPKPKNPCWAVEVENEGNVEVLVFDAVAGEFLGYGVPPPSGSVTITGPGDMTPISCLIGTWRGWARNADYWFTQMGYVNKILPAPNLENVKVAIQSKDTALFYEVAHGHSYAFASACNAGQTEYEYTTAQNVKEWMESSSKMPFTFLVSCDSMCNMGDGTLSYEFRKGSDNGAAVLGYCGLSEGECYRYCWWGGYNFYWQDNLLSNLAKGYSISEAMELTNEAYPGCAECAFIAGDKDLKLVSPLLNREPLLYRIFVTNQTFDGNIGGLEGADFKCQDAANSAGLGGNWKAYLGTNEITPESRIYQSTVEYRRLDGVLIADDWNDLTDGSIKSQIDVNEYGQKIEFAVSEGRWINAWTGSDDFWQKGNSCDEWTDDKGFGGIIGNVNWQESKIRNVSWEGQGWSGCHSKNRMYCVEQP